MSVVERPWYLFLMRHADQRDGHLTEDGSARVRALAARLSEWISAEWRDEPDRTVHLWYTTQATEVRETIDLLTRDVLAEMQRNEPPANSVFGDRAIPEEPTGATHTVNHRQAW